MFEQKVNMVIKMKLAKFSLAVMIAASVSSVFPRAVSAQTAGGITVGDNVSEYNVLETRESQIYAIEPPQSSSLVENYLVGTTSDGLIHTVLLSGYIHSNNEYGDECKSEYDNIKQALTSKYGSGESYEFLRSGALWDRYGDFVPSLYENERSHETLWELQNDKLINLEIEAASHSACWVAVRYRDSDLFNQANPRDYSAF
jgi:hypothetical protein